MNPNQPVHLTHSDIGGMRMVAYAVVAGTLFWSVIGCAILWSLAK
jgi:hypothetical protein